MAAFVTAEQNRRIARDGSLQERGLDGCTVSYRVYNTQKKQEDVTIKKEKKKNPAKKRGGGVAIRPRTVRGPTCILAVECVTGVKTEISQQSRD